MVSRKKRIYFFACVMAFVIFSGFFVYVHNRSGDPAVSEARKFYEQIRSRFLLRGFQFSGYNEKGEKVITIKADKFSVDKKKIGFLTTSLLNVVTVKNAGIEIYSRGNAPEDTVSEIKVEYPGLTFEDLFSRDALPALPAKNISSIAIQPVSLKLYNEDSPVTGLSAESAEIKISRKSMVFRGNVEVRSGERTLTTDKLEFIPEKALFRTDSRFVLETEEGRSQGNGMSSDIFLMSITIRDNVIKMEAISY